MICRWRQSHVKGLKMRKLSQLFKRADVDRKVTHAPANLAADRDLAETQLANVAAAGGKSTASSNPIED
jgi:hypothetical protein